MSIESEVNFCFDFMRLIYLDKQVVFSPSSLLNALAMIFVGADGDTAFEIAKIIGKNKTRKEIIDYYSKYAVTYNNTDNVPTDECSPSPTKKLKHDSNPFKLISANQLFISDKNKLTDLFVNEMNEKFNGQFQQLNFRDTKLSLSTINKFVHQKTGGKIDKFLQDQDLDENTTLILLNVVYFMANWKSKFNPRHKATFYSNVPRTIDMMTGNFYNLNYTKDKNWKCVGIPYRGKNICMFIVLPKEKDGLKNVIESMDYEMFLKCTKEDFLDDKIDVILPIFEISERYDLKNALTKMGICQMFNAEADFSKMFKDQPHLVNKTFHMATIKVDENGTEATAATSFGMMPRSASRPKQFIADHPFIYFIVALGNKINSSNRDDKKESEEEINGEQIAKEILFAGIYC